MIFEIKQFFKYSSIIFFFLLLVIPFCTDLYVFGMGDDVNSEDINDLKTDRGNEKFFFKLKNLDDLQETFDGMIGTSLCLFPFKYMYLV